MELLLETINIPGVLLLTPACHEDDRGAFVQAWQQQFQDLGLPELDPVQMNFSTSKTGTIRGIHVKPWDKLIMLVSGMIQVALVDLRDHESFGTIYTDILRPGKLLYLPSGVGNSFQAQAPEVQYVYLVTGQYAPGATYPCVNPYDSTLGINWMYSRDKHIVSAKDRAAPSLLEAYHDLCAKWLR